MVTRIASNTAAGIRTKLSADVCEKIFVFVVSSWERSLYVTSAHCGMEPVKLTRHETTHVIKRCETVRKEDGRMVEANVNALEHASK